MNDMMNLRRCGDRNGRRSKDEELGNPFFKGDCSSSNEWGDHGVTDDDYEGAPVFDDDYKEAPIFDDDQFEEESMPVYDTDIEYVIGKEEENMEDVVVVANDLCSSMIQTTLSVDFSKNINSNPHELIWSQKGNLVEAMAEKDAFLVDYVEGGLCVDNTDAGIVRRCNSGSNKDKGKGKEVCWTFLNMTEEVKNKNKKQNKRTETEFKEHGKWYPVFNKKPKLECWKCGKIGHFKRDCRSGKKNNANAGGSGKGSKDHSQDQGLDAIGVNQEIAIFVRINSLQYLIQMDINTQISDESQRMIISDDGPSEIPEPRKVKEFGKAKSSGSIFSILIEGSRDLVGSQYS
ncbi:reverse transcriptase domain-containing protein [Tanacetum coccineum]